MVKALVGLGANLGDREANLRWAWRRLGTIPGIRLGGLSRLIETEPVGGPSNQPRYLNGAGWLETDRTPESLLDVLLATESALGRVRTIRWGPRPIDLDLLLYGEEIRRTPKLTLPHPRMAERRFVLEPAAEIAPDFIHPILKRTVNELLADLTAPDNSRPKNNPI